jgi:hypothetical protein
MVRPTGCAVRPLDGPPIHLDALSVQLDGPSIHLDAPSVHLDGRSGDLDGRFIQLDGPLLLCNESSLQLDGPHFHLDGESIQLDGPSVRVDGLSVHLDGLQVRLDVSDSRRDNARRADPASSIQPFEQSDDEDKRRGESYGRRRRMSSVRLVENRGDRGGDRSLLQPSPEPLWILLDQDALAGRIRNRKATRSEHRQHGKSRFLGLPLGQTFSQAFGTALGDSLEKPLDQPLRMALGTPLTASAAPGRRRRSIEIVLTTGAGYNPIEFPQGD